MERARFSSILTLSTQLISLIILGIFCFHGLNIYKIFTKEESYFISFIGLQLFKWCRGKQNCIHCRVQIIVGMCMKKSFCHFSLPKVRLDKTASCCVWTWLNTRRYSRSFHLLSISRKHFSFHAIIWKCLCTFYITMNFKRKQNKKKKHCRYFLLETTECRRVSDRVTFSHTTDKKKKDHRFLDLQSTLKGSSRMGPSIHLSIFGSYF